ncbi:hypothetical protein ACFFX0_10060 [Citricoccus parietis]|uniref:Uncharacterized protein n=1 Tax=Citricoccus parietis TaxID=592307 RepID=A0ABV5FXY0_9MICC
MAPRPSNTHSRSSGCLACPACRTRTRTGEVMVFAFGESSAGGLRSRERWSNHEPRPSWICGDGRVKLSAPRTSPAVPGSFYALTVRIDSGGNSVQAELAAKIPLDDVAAQRWRGKARPPVGRDPESGRRVRTRVPSRSGSTYLRWNGGDHRSNARRHR